MNQRKEYPTLYITKFEVYREIKVGEDEHQEHLADITLKDEAWNVELVTGIISSDDLIHVANALKYLEEENMERNLLSEKD